MMDTLQDDNLTQESQEVCVKEFTIDIPQQGEEEKFQSQSDIFKVYFKRKEMWMSIMM